MLFVKESLVRAKPESVFAFHELPDALQRLTPEWERVRVVEAAKSLHVGSIAVIETRLFGFIPARWVAEHTVYDPPHMFEDVQIKGPFKLWRHRHIVCKHADGAVLRDEIRYEPPLGFVGRLVVPVLIVPRLQKLFDYRHAVTRNWCERGEEESEMNKETKERVPREESSHNNMRNTRDQSKARGRMAKAKGWLIAGSSVAALMYIAYWKGRSTDKEYLKS